METVRSTRERVREIFTFPDPVNEYAARWVAGLVLALTLVILVFDMPLLLPVLAYGFLARVLTGPKLSPFGLLATRVLVPVFGNHRRAVPGPPKRFAQAVGFVFSGAALILWPMLGVKSAGVTVLAVLAVCAAAESIFGFCVGCYVFARLMTWGVVPRSVCERCVSVGANVNLNLP